MCSIHPPLDQTQVLTLGTNNPSLIGRVRGSLLGGAVGDVLGAGVEDYVPAYGRIGAIADDTQMTPFSAQGIIFTEQYFAPL